MAASLPDSEVDRQLVNAIQHYWKEHQAPILLSQLGSQIPREDSTRIKEEHGNLATYLRQELSEHISLIQSHENPTIIGAIPVGLDPSSLTDTDALLSRTPRRGVQALPRFHSAFWAAFVKELDPDVKRHISVGPPPRFRDIDQDAKPENTIEVAREYICGTDEDVGNVHKSIGNWLQEHNLQEKPFLADVALTQDQLPTNDLLGKLVVALSPDELRRLSIPMDIVSKLRRHSV